MDKPKHVGITLYSCGDADYCAGRHISADELYARRERIVLEIMGLQEELGIPVITIYLLPFGESSDDGFSQLFRAISNEAQKGQVKISVLGKWYDLPGRVVDSIKSMVDSTRDYDRLFFNICVNYDGREEIVDACRVVALKVKAEKMDADNISQDIVKENLYTSYFIPPDAIIKTCERRLDSFLLWDSARSEVHFTGRHWSEFSAKEMKKVLGI